MNAAIEKAKRVEAESIATIARRALEKIAYGHTDAVISEMNDFQIGVLRRLSEGQVPCSDFKTLEWTGARNGPGMKIAMLVRRGFAEWLYNDTRTDALALRITDLGRQQLNLSASPAAAEPKT